MQKFAITRRGNGNGLLVWKNSPISTGPLEGTYNKIENCNDNPAATETDTTSDSKSTHFLNENLNSPVTIHNQCLWSGKSP